MSNHVCVFCGSKGSRGADWVLKIGNDSYRVHKPCGEKLAAHAPEGLSPKLSSSEELRREWQAERQRREAEAFWAEKFKAAQAAREKVA